MHENDLCNDLKVSKGCPYVGNGWKVSFAAKFLCQKENVIWWVVTWFPVVRLELNGCWNIPKLTWASWKYGEDLPLYGFIWPQSFGSMKMLPRKELGISFPMPRGSLPQCLNIAVVYPWLANFWIGRLLIDWSLESWTYKAHCSSSP